MNLSILQLGWRTLLRDLRAGELRLLAVAVTLAVAALTSVAFFADRLQGGLQRDALQILGGDAVVASDNPTPASFVQRARALGLQGVTSVGFPTMGRASDAQGGASRLVAFKSVQPGYPLRGSLTVAEAPGAEERKTRDIPAPGEVWVDAPLLDALGLRMGDALLLGDASLRITRIIIVEPDRGAGFMAFAPRVMVNDADVPATGLVQPASRLTYRFAVAGRAAAGPRPLVGGAPPAACPPAWPGGASRRPCASSAPGPLGKWKNRACTVCAWNRLNRDAPKCSRRWTARKNSSASWHCWPRCCQLWPWRCRHAALPPAISTHRPCCACWARARAPLRAVMQWNFSWWAWPPAAWACCWALPCTMCSCCCWPGWWNRACLLPVACRWRWAWAWGSRCSSPLVCRPCCSWPRCRRCG